MHKYGRKAGVWTLAVCTVLMSFGTGAFAAEKKETTGSYRTVTEVEDWGPAVTKLIVDIGRPIPIQSVATDTFKVHVVRSDGRLEDPVLEEGYRNVTKAYVADASGKPAVKAGKHVVLEMEIGPTLTLGSAMNFSVQTYLNDWIDSSYTITQQKPIATAKGNLTGLVVDTFKGEVRELVDDFRTKGKFTHNGVRLTYADYTPAKDKSKNPLIIWLHGMGEGGTDPTVAIAGNKAVNFASKGVQGFFGGAYVLAPQTPTFWMDGLEGFGDGTSKYESALMALIESYVKKNKDIDTNRIYIGGDSNGGYMTMLMIRDYPGYFAAAFPTCEALKDTLITDADIERMKNLPIWFVAAKTDQLVPPAEYAVPTYERLVAAGAKDVHLSLFDNVVDTSGLYTKADGTPFEYDGHWSWIYVYNNDVSEQMNGTTITLMQWLAGQSLNKK
ncbi:prolyl oligopeptidase family serine peptidase [Paenibacillus sp. IB182493]|uniref:Prolyl oligopeptidase family serine peptidase n=2 Tax=Paenibacillus arenilitoris TaxID=2772299 RepID=A0A927CHW7_9BACL|nr:prolyl oligopeptidase family serine peptidase [Paenibacillus arenilitoris]